MATARGLEVNGEFHYPQAGLVDESAMLHGEPPAASIKVDSHGQIAECKTTRRRYNPNCNKLTKTGSKPNRNAIRPPNGQRNRQGTRYDTQEVN